MMRFIRTGICILVTFAVLAHGTVEPWSECVLEIGAALLLVVWCWMIWREPGKPIAWNALLGPLFAFWLLAAYQAVAGATAVPFLTHIERLKFTALLALTFLFIQAFRTQAQMRRFVWFLLSLAFTVSLFGILQHFTFNGKIYWFRELRYGGIPFGPYVNRDHFAGLMELLIPPGLAVQFVRAEENERLPLLALFTLIPIGALFLAASRGGIVGFIAELGFLAVLILVHRREKKVLGATVIFVSVAVALVLWLGVGRALERFSKYQKLEVTESRRIEMMHDSAHIFRDHPLLGTGLGTLQEVFPRYESYYDGLIVNHSHNDYIEALAETGIAGGLCGLAFLMLLFWEGWKRIGADREARSFAYHSGALVSCLGLLVHGLVDFNFHIPANALIFLLLGVLATTRFSDLQPLK